MEAPERPAAVCSISRRHVTGGVRLVGHREVAGGGGPDDETQPPPPNPSLALPPLRKPGRNELCTCGSGRKVQEVLLAMTIRPFLSHRPENAGAAARLREALKIYDRPRDDGKRGSITDEDPNGLLTRGFGTFPKVRELAGTDS